MKPESVSGPTVHQLKISLAGSRPPIWRRVLVSSDATLTDLHYVIQAIMGWEEEHLHMFEAPGPGEKDLRTNRSRRTSVRYFPTNDPLGEPLDWLDAEEDGDEAEVTLTQVARNVKSYLLYTYDMGDSWEHEIVVEKILPADPDGAYPICLAGKRNGPIEDSGGIWGYEALLQTLANPQSEDYKETKQWLREAFGLSTWDGDAFDQERINKRLKKLQPKKRRRAAPARRTTAGA